VDFLSRRWGEREARGQLGAGSGLVILGIRGKGSVGKEEAVHGVGKRMIPHRYLCGQLEKKTNDHEAGVGYWISAFIYEKRAIQVMSSDSCMYGSSGEEYLRYCIANLVMNMIRFQVQEIVVVRFPLLCFPALGKKSQKDHPDQIQ